MKPRGVNNMQESGKNDVSMLEENVSTGNQQLTETENSTEALDQRAQRDPNVDPTVDSEPTTADPVAVTDESGFTEVVPEEVQPQDKLAELMKLSREMSESFGIEPAGYTNVIVETLSPGGILLPTAEEVRVYTDQEIAESKERLDEHFRNSETFQKIMSPERVAATHQAIDGIIAGNVSAGLGPQPDGSHKLVVTIAEGYFEGIKSQAESDGVTPEEWVSTKFANYMEQWWFSK